MDTARTAIGLLAALSVAQQSRYEDGVDDADGAQRHDKDEHQCGYVKKLRLPLNVRIAKHAKFKLAASRLVDQVTRIGSAPFVLHRYLYHFEDENE
jgi:hypothetical protein